MTATLLFHADCYRVGMHQPPHRHDELHLSIVLSGGVAETVSGETVHGGPLSVVAKDAGVMHENRFGASSTRMARLSLRDGSIGALIDDPSRRREWHWTSDAAVARPFLRLVRRAQGSAASFVATDPDVVDLLAAFTARPVAESRSLPPAWLVATMDYLRSDWHPGLTVGSIARRAGVHPVYLARCVRRWYGTGLGEELRRIRLRAAAAAIGRSRETISRIAFGSGFADEPHFCREFGQAFGMTPGRYRALLRDLPPHPPGGR